MRYLILLLVLVGCDKHSKTVKVFDSAELMEQLQVDSSFKEYLDWGENEPDEPNVILKSGAILSDKYHTTYATKESSYPFMKSMLTGRVYNMQSCTFDSMILIDAMPLILKNSSFILRYKIWGSKQGEFYFCRQDGIPNISAKISE